MTRPYRACNCRAPAITRPDGKRQPGKLLGKSCPRLKDGKHGKWFVRFEAPAGDGARRQPRLGPFDTQKEAKDALTVALGQVRDRKFAADRRTTVADYLAAWLEDQRSSLKPRTWASYEEAVRLYFTPGLGHIRLADLDGQPIRDLYNAMRKINRPGREDGDEMLRRLLAARAVVPHLKHRWGTRPIGEAGIKRRHVVLAAALADAIERGLIVVNPASTVKLRVAKARPLLWTEPRVERWRKDCRRPAASMVWTPAQCGAFLDSTEADRLYPLYHLAAYWGLRRSELAGLEWADVDLNTRRLHVRQAQSADELDTTKSEASERIIVLDQDTAQVLAKWHERQLFERLEWGETWQDSGRVFTREDGRPLRPAHISEHFGVLVRQAALPPVRFHDLRHGAASMLLAAGQPPKVVSEILGHSTVAFTMDVYAVVAEELAEAAAVAIAAFVPRRSKTEADR